MLEEGELSELYTSHQNSSASVTHGSDQVVPFIHFLREKERAAYHQMLRERRALFRNEVRRIAGGKNHHQALNRAERRAVLDYADDLFEDILADHDPVCTRYKSFEDRRYTVQLMKNWLKQRLGRK